MKRINISTLFFLTFLVLAYSQTSGQSNWNQFRGPNGSGVAENTSALAVEFDQSNNLIWKTEINDGHSSPCIWGDNIFLTALNGKILETICLNKNTGEIKWKKSIEPERLERVHPIGHSATPTPTTDGKGVFVYFGSWGLICYDFDGNVKWERKIPIHPNMYGTAVSPILYKDYLIFSRDTGVPNYKRTENSSLEAINKENGETIWKTDREGFDANWSTPMFYNNNGVDELLIYGIWWLKAYSLKDGTELWAIPGMTDEPCNIPVEGEGLIYLTTYNMKTNTEVIGIPKYSELLKDYDLDKDGELTFKEIEPNKSFLSRYDADGEGDHPLKGFFRFLDKDQSGKLTSEEWDEIFKWLDQFKQENALMAIKPGVKGQYDTEVVWRYTKGVPECPSPIYYKGLVYMLKNGGIFTCLDAKTGDLKYEEKIGSGGPYYSSPVIGDGKIYTSSARGVVTVLAVGDKLNILAKNDLKERIMATPAIVDGVIYVRTQKGLYAFGLN
ncbi:PQQ-binding-like beta-propeller repeat protein [Bacteroidota bacterium]